MIDTILDFFQNFIVNLGNLWHFISEPINIPLLGEITPLALFGSSALIGLLTFIVIKGVVS